MKDEIKERIEKVYELVDNSEDVYYCLGLYHTLEEALADATHGDEPCCDAEETCHMEIRERSFGFSGWGEHGKLVAEIYWCDKYDEEKDEYLWGKPEVTLKPLKK